MADRPKPPPSSKANQEEGQSTQDRPVSKKVLKTFGDLRGSTAGSTPSAQDKKLSTESSKVRVVRTPARPQAEAKKLALTTSKTLTLKPHVSETGVVRQSFSHGRNKSVVVEKIRSRKPGRHPNITDEEARRRNEALLRAREDLRAEEAGQRAEQEAQRRAGEEARRRAEEEARREAEEEARRRAEEEARREAEEEARRRAEEEARREAEEEARRRAEDARRREEEEARRRRAMSDAQETSVTIPPIEVIPAQSRRAIAFSSVEYGPLSLLPDEDAEIDQEQAQLYSKLRAQLVKVIEQIPSQERGEDVTDQINDFLGHPPAWSDVKYKKLLWLSGNTLRNTLAQHDLVSRDPDPHYAKLPYVVAEAVRRPVETWNIVVLGDPVLRELDSQRLGPQENIQARDEIASARPILEAAADDRRITTQDAGVAVRTTLAAATVPADNINTRQARELAQGTFRNLITQILRGAHRMAQDLTDPDSEEAQRAAKEYTAAMYKTAGEWTVKGAAIGATGAAGGVVAMGYYYGIPFFEFVVSQAPVFKAYLGDAFQNPQLQQIVDSLQQLRRKLEKLAEGRQETATPVRDP